MSVLFECRDLAKSYGKVQALKGINLQLESGRIVGLLGPNGSGKTTLIKLANRLLQPSSGSIRIAGEEPGILTKEKCAYLPDKDSAYWDRIDAALVWNHLMPYYILTVAGSVADGISMVYDRSEPNVLYIYYHAAYIDKVRILNAYGSSDGQLPDYIKQKNWASPNPFMTGTTVRLCENGGCGFNHDMSLGTVSFEMSLRDLP